MKRTINCIALLLLIGSLLLAAVIRDRQLAATAAVPAVMPAVMPAPVEDHGIKDGEDALFNYR